MTNLQTGLTTTHPSSSRAEQRATLLSAVMASFLTSFLGSATNVAMPAIGREFAMDAVLLSWIPTAYLLAASIFLVPFGRLADIHGRKRVFLSGMAVVTTGALVAGLSTTGTLLLVARVVQGIGSALIFGTSVAILTSVYPPGERGRVLGLSVAAVYVGLSVGPTIGGVLTQHLGWRSIFFVLVPVGLTALAFALTQLKGEWAEARGEPFDLRGTILYALALIGVMVGFSQLPSWSGVGLIAAGGAVMVLFGAWELRTPHPVLNLRLFIGNRAFTLSNLAALISYSATAAVTYLLSLYLQYIKALDPQQAGLVLIAQPVVQATLSPLTGRLSDRIEPRVIASAGMAITAIGLSLLIFVGPGTPWWIVSLCLAFLGLGFALFSSPNMNAIMGSVDRRFYGVASGTQATMRLLGQMLSMGIATLLFALFVGRVEIVPQVYPQFLNAIRTAFALFAALCALGILASLVRGNVRPTENRG